MTTDAKTLQKQYVEAPVEDRIRRLEEARDRLVTRKMEAEGKLSAFREVRRERERKVRELEMGRVYNGQGGRNDGG